MIKCDLHAHISENASVEDLKMLLTMAEEENVKGLGVLSYNALNIYEPNGIFKQVMNEGINNYFTGKLISAVEMVCQIDKIPSKNNFDYYGFRADICLYDFDYEKLQKHFSPQVLSKYWEEDFKMFAKLSKDIGIDIPEIENFVNDYHPLSFIDQIMKKYPEVIEEFGRILGQTIVISSDLSRNHITNPNGKLFFEQKLFPKVSTILKIAKEVGCKVAIAHPAYMSNLFNTTDYIRSLVEFSRSDDSYQNIEYVCGDYMLNTQKDCQEIDEIANELKIKKICGSDMRLMDQMFYKGVLSTEKVTYKPRPGFAIAKLIETGKGDLLMEEKVLNDFLDLKI